MDKNLYKKCPRCKQKLMMSASKCPACGFNYAKLAKATNAGAKEQIKAGHKENVIYVTTRPQDVPRKNFLVLFWAFGWLGVHNIYIGKYGRGISHLVSFSIFMFVFLLYYFFLTGYGWVYSTIVTPLATVYAFFLIAYVADIVNLIFGKFKYPVSVPISQTVDDVIKERDK